MSVMTAAEARTLFGDVGLLTATITVQQWGGAAWAAVSGWTAQPAVIAGGFVEPQANVPAAQAPAGLPDLNVPLTATVVSPGIPPGPYAARFHHDVGSQGLVYRVDLRLLGSAGGDQWMVVREQNDGITAASETDLGVITAYKAPPEEPSLITSEGDIQVQRDKDAMLIPPPTAVTLMQGLILESVAIPALRFRIMTLDLLDELDDTNSPYWLEATLEPA